MGFVTDQLALKIIFEPVVPKKIGPLTIQGLFLKRQVERLVVLPHPRFPISRTPFPPYVRN